MQVVEGVTSHRQALLKGCLTFIALFIIYALRWEEFGAFAPPFPGLAPTPVVRRRWHTSWL